MADSPAEGYAVPGGAFVPKVVGSCSLIALTAFSPLPFSSSKEQQLHMLCPVHTFLCPGIAPTGAGPSQSSGSPTGLWEQLTWPTRLRACSPLLAWLRPGPCLKGFQFRRFVEQQAGLHLSLLSSFITWTSLLSAWLIQVLSAGPPESRGLLPECWWLI